MKVIKLNNTEIVNERNILSHTKLVWDLYQPSEYETDITSYKTLYTYYTYGQLDYSEFRRSLREHIIPHWDNLSFFEKQQLVEHYIYPSTLTSDKLLPLFGDESKMKEKWENFISQSKVVHKERWEMLSRNISFYLNRKNSGHLYLLVLPFRDSWLDTGNEEIIAWFSDEVGQYGDYRESGFSSQIYGHPLLKELALSILIYGKEFEIPNGRQKIRDWRKGDPINEEDILHNHKNYIVRFWLQ